MKKWMTMWTICFLLVFFCTTQGQFLGSKQIIFDHIEQCTSVKADWDAKVVTLKTARGKTAFSLDVNSTSVIDDKTILQIDISIKRNGAWLPNYSNLVFKKVCSLIKEKKPDVFQQLARDSNIPPQCPLKKGHLILNKYEIDLNQNSLLPISILPIAQFRVTASLKGNRRTYFCVNAYVEIKMKARA